jgi:hypothetical protein
VSSHDLLEAAHEAAGDVGAALEFASRYGPTLPLPGGGRTAERWSILSAIAAEDLTVARVLEPHADALAILAEAGQPADDGTWGVFAAEVPGSVLLASRDRHGSVRLYGTKRWCSLAARLDHALITASQGTDRMLFAVDLHDATVHPDAASGWASRGLAGVESAAVSFDGTPARPVGEPGWYLDRPGFAWGGIGVAACWLGGAQALVATLHHAVAAGGSELGALHLGTVDAAVHAARAALRDAAHRVDCAAATGRSGHLLALRVRSVIAQAAELTITQVGHALGPAPLCFDEEHARRVADLQVYLRQHHGERDLAALGRLLAESDA